MCARADELFELALHRNRALRAPPLVVWTQLDYAQALLRRGKRSTSRARQLLRDAADVAGKLEMFSAQERIRALV